MTKLIVPFRNAANVPKMGAIKILEVEKEHFFFHICHPGVFLLTHIISLLSVIHTIYSVIQYNAN